MELTLDTASDLASVAISNKGLLVGERTWRCVTNHSVEVLPAVDQLLSVARLDRADLGAIFVCRGPGSYGGLRAGLSLAMSIAAALQIDILGIGRLEADAYQHATGSGPICAIHRAGRGEIAWAAYRAREGDLEELVGPRLGGPAAVAADAPRRALFCGEIDDELRLLLEERDSSIRIASPSASVRRAGSLAELAWHRYERGQRAPNGFVEPIYLREPNITKPKPRL